MLQFVVGPALSGKTRTLQQQAARLCEAGGLVVLVVPEQFVFATERMLLRQAGAGFAARISVLSLTRMAHRLGADGCRVAEGAAKQALTAVALASCRERLQVYAKQAKYPSFVPIAVDALHRFKQAGADAARLAELSARCERPLLAAKLRDFSIIAAEYEGRLSGQYFDPDDDMKRLADRLDADNPYAGADVLFDSFKGFTETEFFVLRRLLRDAKSCVFSFSGDRAHFADGEADSLFYGVGRTVERLRRIADEEGVAESPPLFLEQTHCVSPGLSGLERFYRAGGAPPTDDGSVTLTECPTPHGEAEDLAFGIEKLVREKGLRYSDIAVIARDPAAWRGVLDRVLARYEIPFFWDDRKPLSFSPVFRFVKSALEAVHGSPEQILPCLKSGFFGIAPEQVGRLENRAFITCKTGADFKRVWEDPNDEAIRSAVMAPLMRLSEETDRVGPRDFAAAVYRLVSGSGTAQRMQAGAAMEGQLRLEALVVDPTRTYNAFIALLDSFVSALEGALGPSGRLPATSYIEILTLMADAVTIGEIPQRIDSVQIGGADLIRPADLRAVFVIGANEGIFPADPVETTPFSAAESGWLRQNDVELEAEAAARAADESFLVYSALFCASEQLGVSWSRSDLSDGRELTPSAFVQRLSGLLPGAVRDSRTRPFAERICSPTQALTQLYAATDAERAALSEALRQRGQGEALARLETAPQFGRTRRAPGAAHALFGDRIRLYPTQIETFIKCPFQYYCGKALRVEPLRRDRIDARRYGEAFHAAAEKLLRASPDGSAILSRSEDELTAAIRAILEDLWPQFYKRAPQENRHDRFFVDRMLRQLCADMRRVAGVLASEKFRPALFEVKMEEGSPIAPLSFTVDGLTVTVGGVIDRLDTYTDPDGTQYLRVVDYKSGHVDFTSGSNKKGLLMQPVYYLQAACDSAAYRESQPAAFYFVPLNVQPKRASGPDDLKTRRDAEKMQGVCLNIPAVRDALADRSCYKESACPDFAALFAEADGRAVDMAGRLVRGNFDAEPAGQDVCRWCDYRRVCYRGRLAGEDGEGAGADADE